MCSLADFFTSSNKLQAYFAYENITLHNSRNNVTIIYLKYPNLFPVSLSVAFNKDDRYVLSRMELKHVSRV